MKDWQKGFNIDWLKELEEFFSDYNSQSLSPFSKYKKNDIAADLYEGNLKLIYHENGLCAAYVVNKTKAKSKITMYGDVVLGEKYVGDVTLTKIVGSYHDMLNIFKSYYNDNVWLYVWGEGTLGLATAMAAQECGYKYVGSKISTFSEIQFIYYRESNLSLMDRTHPNVDELEKIGIKKVFDGLDMIKIAAKLSELPEFQNHYSNYNKGKSWGALALRGYSNDPQFIAKPEEMSKKWKQENMNVTYELQDTPLYEKFDEVKSLLSFLTAPIHRVRFMKLEPGGGELQRHTDQVDPDAGGSIGKLARLHFPIVTNPNMIFSVWGLDGFKQEYNMKVGEMWLLDTRKPHMAVNNGSEPRIHLVVDTEIDKNLKETIINS